MKKVLFLLLVSSLLLQLSYSDDKSKNEIKEKNYYETVEIGTQVWMKRNLDVSTYRNGDPIRHCESNADWIDAGNKKEGAWCFYNNDSEMGKIYGKLYNWYAVNDPRGLAPEGWHVPRDEEWTTLTNYLGGKNVAGGKLMESDTTHWKKPHGIRFGSIKFATNKSGFTALPGGYRVDDGTFDEIGYVGIWGSSTKNVATEAKYWQLHYNSADLYSFLYLSESGDVKEYGFSVRCVKD